MNNLIHSYLHHHATLSPKHVAYSFEHLNISYTDLNHQSNQLAHALLALEVKVGDRIGIYSYGSGSCAEFYGAVAGEKARQVAAASQLDKLLDQRKDISVEAYEALEDTRLEMIRNGDFQPDFAMTDQVYETHFKNQGLLVYQGSNKFYRHYEFV